MNKNNSLGKSIDLLVRHAAIMAYTQGMRDGTDAAMWLSEEKTGTINPHVAYLRRKDRLYNRYMAQFGHKPEPLYKDS